MKIFRQVILPTDNPFLNNKYTVWYYGIINNAKSRDIEGYTERHHIIPESLFKNRIRKGSAGFLPGEPNIVNNLVNLTAREHIICHWLLVKMVQDPWNLKMEQALSRMSQQSFDRGITIPSIIYERMKIARSIHSQNTKWFTNGVTNTRAIDCPEGYWPGMTHSQEGIESLKLNGAKGAKLCTRGPWYTNGVKNIRSNNPPPEYWLGYTMSQEELLSRQSGGHKAIETRRRNKTDKLSPKACATIKKGRQGQVWWTNGIENKLSRSCPGQGFMKGYTKTEDYIRLKKAKKWWNNGTNHVCSELCPIGYVPGKLKTNHKWWTNGLYNKMALECPAGYWLGRTIKV